MTAAVLVLACVVHAITWITLAGNLFYLRRHAPTVARAGAGRLSVLIPARNEETNLDRLLPSLLRQDHPDFEVIVINDGSTDGTEVVLENMADEHLTYRTISGPPEGWVGKVHALFQASRTATGERYLFLDADAEILRRDSLRRMDELFACQPDQSVVTGMPMLRGGGFLLVSLVSAIILSGLPWLLVRRIRHHSLSALNGQAWMIDAVDYHRFEPHEHHPDEILEDVVIGRYLKRRGMTPVLADLRQDVAVHMYSDLSGAWQGFRKNAYLILGGTPFLFTLLWAVFAASFGIAPLLAPILLLSLYGIKATCDRIMRFPILISVLTPVSYWMGIVLQLDSAFTHWRGIVSWKGRTVGSGTQKSPSTTDLPSGSP